jgi:hypothetical protein
MANGILGKIECSRWNLTAKNQHCVLPCTSLVVALRERDTLCNSIMHHIASTRQL